MTNLRPLALSATQLAYLVGLPPNEVPAVEIARGDLVEVVPASYGVVSKAFRFWSGEGRGDPTSGANLYENFAESTIGKLDLSAAENQGLLPEGVTDMVQETEREAESLKEAKELDEQEQREKGKRGRASEWICLCLLDFKLRSVR